MTWKMPHQCWYQDLNICTLFPTFKNYIYIHTYICVEKTVAINLDDMDDSYSILCGFVFFQLMSMDGFYDKTK